MSTKALILGCALLGCATYPTQREQNEDDPTPAWTPPALSFPARESDEELRLSQLGLYRDIKNKVLAPDLTAYEPRYPLWSDGADKRRWLRLPAGKTIDNSDPDHWQFPVGSVLFKEFSRAGKLLETRVIARVGESVDETFMGTFLWQEDEQDAILVRNGSSNVRGTDHDLPTQINCGTCHNGEPGRVLGFSAVQQSEPVPELLLRPQNAYVVPGALETARALGYLHANCGHCHNPHGSARRETPMVLRLSVSDNAPGSTGTEHATVLQPLYSFTATDLMFRVLPGEPEQSGLLARMKQRDTMSAMPPLGTKHVDEEGLATVRAWIAGLSPAD